LKYLLYISGNVMKKHTEIVTNLRTKSQIVAFEESASQVINLTTFFLFWFGCGLWKNEKTKFQHQKLLQAYHLSTEVDARELI
jgi:hypothetical protein